MKAKEYFDKYVDDMTAGVQLFKDTGDMKGIDDTVATIFRSMSGELGDMMHKRKIRTADGCLGALNEYNTKWNAIASLFNKELGFDIMARNGFRELYFHDFPQFKELHERRKKR